MPYRAFPFHDPTVWDRILWVIPFVLFALVLAVAAVLVIRLVDRGARPTGPPPYPPPGSADQALAHVRYRYASGQLSREEYFQLLTDLGGGPPPTPATPAPTGQS